MASFCGYCGNELQPFDQFCGSCGKPTARATKGKDSLHDRQPFRRRRSWLAVLVVAIASAAAAGLVWWFFESRTPPDAQVSIDNSTLVDALDGDAGYQSALAGATAAAAPMAPDAVSMPSVAQESESAVRAYFDAAGAPLLQFLGVVEGSWSSLNEESCEDFASQLEGVSTPPQLVVLSDQVPDEPTRDTLANLVSFTVRHVAQCGGDPAMAGEVAWHWAVVVRRLAELGVMVP